METIAASPVLQPVLVAARAGITVYFPRVYLVVMVALVAVQVLPAARQDRQQVVQA
jgi:hypothetical protein